MDYRRAVRESKKRMQQDLNQDSIKKISQEAKEHLMAKSLNREQMNTTSIMNDRNEMMEA